MSQSTGKPKTRRCLQRGRAKLAARGHDAKRVVVERNGEILPRELFFPKPYFCEADNLEIVHFVRARQRPNYMQPITFIYAPSRRRAQ